MFLWCFSVIGLVVAAFTDAIERLRRSSPLDHDDSSPARPHEQYSLLMTLALAAVFIAQTRPPRSMMLAARPRHANLFELRAIRRILKLLIPCGLVMRRADKHRCITLHLAPPAGDGPFSPSNGQFRARVPNGIAASRAYQAQTGPRSPLLHSTFSHHVTWSCMCETRVHCHCSDSAYSLSFGEVLVLLILILFLL